MHEPISQVAVVRQEQEPFACFIETANRVHALADLWYEIHDERPPCRIAICAQITLGLVDEPVHRALDTNRLAVNADSLIRPDLGAQLADGMAIHRHAAGANQFLALAA
jgi:hypothetical protein